MTIALTLPDHYGCVLFASVALAFQCYLVGFTVAQYKRKKLFNKEFMAKHFGDDHKKEFGCSAPDQGYPDHGSGRYSDKLSYRQWYELNNAFRCHQNFIETIAILILSLLVAGLYYPLAAAILGAVHFVGRTFYILGYVTAGPDKRVIGAIIAHGTTLIALVLALISSAKLANLVNN